MRDAVVATYEARKNLALTLKDTRTVVGKLENILAVGLHGVCFLFYLSIFNVSLPFSYWASFHGCHLPVLAPPLAGVQLYRMSLHFSTKI